MRPTSRSTKGGCGSLMSIAAVAATALAHEQHAEALADENRRLQSELEIEHQMIGDSPVMRSLFRRIGRVAPSDSTVLIIGESGTGKELVARAIHSNSPRADRPFVAINCAAIPETLLESELFGHEKGAFTGAIAQQEGAARSRRDGGTVFLDEIGELPPPLQAKLLRVLQEREFERVGGTRRSRVDFRLVAATNRDLRASDRRRRASASDLYYRLNVVSLAMPPLRERPDDIPLLANHFAPAPSRPMPSGRLTGVSAERDGVPDGLRLARQRARAGQRDRAGGGAGLERHHRAGRPPGDVDRGGTDDLVRHHRRRRPRAVSRRDQADEERADCERLRLRRRQLQPARRGSSASTPTTCTG